MLENLFLSNIRTLIFLSICLILQAYSSNDPMLDTLSDTNQEYVNRTTGDLQSKKKPWEHVRLLIYNIPLHYDLSLNLDLNNDSFTGEVNITVNVTQVTKYLIVHAKDLTITNYEVYNPEINITMEVNEVHYNHKYDYFILEMDKDILPSKYIFRFEFYNNFQPNYVWYIDENKENKSYASTFFAPNYARNVFPCFDEPSFKATFSVKILHESKYFALSNAEVKQVSFLRNDKTVTTFEKTLPMSTYLLCIFISDFNFKETMTKNGIRLRAYAPASSIDKTEFALTSAQKILTHFEDVLGVVYPLNKLDLISLPYFDINGMENWGLITFLDTSFLIDNTSTSAQKLKTLNLVAHELAHMWFGNLVTMEWFGDTWLNEGFATYFAWKGAKVVLPEYFEMNDVEITEMYSIMEEDKPLKPDFKNLNISELIITNIFDEINYKNASAQEFHGNIELDGTLQSPPVVRHITDLNFGSVYDAIVYKKGSSILRMMENFMEEDFMEGISKYLSKYAFRNVNTDDLWRELSAVSQQNLDIKELMDPWVKQSNYPIITIQCMKSEIEEDLKQIEIFIDDVSSDSLREFPNLYTWNIPLHYRVIGNSSINYMMMNSTNSVVLTVPKNDWIKFNSDFKSYYSVNYDIDSWKEIINILEVNHTIFSPSDRVNLLFDAFNLASLGVVSYDIPLNLTRYLKQEEFYDSWSLGLKHLSSIKKLFAYNQNMQNLISKYIKSLSNNVYQKYGWNDEGNFLERQLREILIEAACSNDHHECLHTAVEAFKSWMEGNEIQSETSEFVFKYGLKELNDEHSFNFMWNHYLTEINPLMKIKFRNALPAVGNESLLIRLLEYSINETYFNPTLRRSLLKSIASNVKGFPVVVDYLSHWDDVVEGIGVSSAETIAQDVYQMYQTREDFNKVRNFYKYHPATKEGILPRVKTLKSIRNHIYWHEKYEIHVERWFQNNVKENNH